MKMTLREIESERKKIRNQMVEFKKNKSQNQAVYEELKRKLYELDWQAINLKEKENEKNE